MKKSFLRYWIYGIAFRPNANTPRALEIKHRDTENARLQAEGLKMPDPAQRASVSREDCLAVAERNRVATGITPGANANSDVLFERAKINCMQYESKP